MNVNLNFRDDEQTISTTPILTNKGKLLNLASAVLMNYVTSSLGGPYSCRYCKVNLGRDYIKAHDFKHDGSCPVTIARSVLNDNQD